MKIGYFVNSINSVNWGGQATSHGIKYLVETTRGDDDFIPIDLPNFPFNKIRVYRKWYEYKLSKAILNDDRENVLKNLEKLNIKRNFFENIDFVCFNGEGAIHSKSGHFIRLMGILYEFNKRKIWVSSINQTVDIYKNSQYQKILKKVYSEVNFLSVREPVSKRELEKIGLNPFLIPDAAYFLPKLEETDIIELTSRFNLPEKYITITGSSYLSRNKKSLSYMEKVLKIVNIKFPHVKLYFLANTKTDLYLANKLVDKFNYYIISYDDIKYKTAEAIISRSYCLIGGRQHPNIFAFIYNTPFIAFSGNSHKMEGVIELMNYPIKVLNWNSKSAEISSEIDYLKNNYKDLSNLSLENINTLINSNKNKIFGD
jgi:polysaccharide pyruvyl transferase WcaK-like protein